MIGDPEWQQKQFKLLIHNGLVTKGVTSVILISTKKLSDHVQNKKCGNVSGVSKVVEEKKKEKAPKAACDQSRTRKFSTKWQVCPSWLKNDEEKGMTCKWCVANKRTDCSETRPDLSMAVLTKKRSRFHIMRKVQPIFLQSNAIEIGRAHV